ncbi:MAG: autotransporter-associated beta strand repeat-containing protein [Burkholderiales bacterium]|nr:autotransporter-associated beta strand repeat-containing protein [Opitutaceae bacterium]
MNSSRKLSRHLSATRSRVRCARWAAVLLGALQSLEAQSTFQETFTGTSATGWNFGGTGYTPTLTANIPGSDANGSGWLRLTDNGNDRSTYALLDTEIFSVGAQIQIEMDYAFYNGSGADGITFFLVDGTTNIGTFTAGAYGGSLGYAQKNEAATGIPGGVAGMDGGYLGFGFDNFGNYSNPTEGRNGGTAFTPNSIAVRGPESSSFEYINGANLNTYGQMDFPSATTRPGQTGADYRSFRLTLDANNLLVVEMKFGASADYVAVFSSNLIGYVRPETFKIGFTGATGNSTEIHEIRNLTVVTTPNATIGGSYEWDDGKASTDDNWGATNPTNEANANWFSLDSGNNNKTPFIDSDIFFGSRPANTSAGVASRPSPYASVQTVNLNNNVEVRSLNFNSKYDYQLGGPGTITLGDTTKTGTPSIAVTDPISNPRFHKIDNALIVVENLVVANQSHSTLNLNGTMNLGANTLATVGAGQTNFNGVITGSGPIIATGASPNGRDSTGIVTLNADNGTAYTGAITINGGQIVALHNNALGNTAAGTTVNGGGTLTFRGGITTSEPLTIAGNGTALSEIWDAGAIFNDGGSNILNGAITLSGDSVIRSRAGNLTLNGVVGQTGGTRSLTKTGDGVLTLNGSSAGYTGATIIQGGALRVTNENGLAGGFSTNGATGSNLTLAGGVLELGTGTNFTRQIGTGADQVRWTGDGGFSASGGARTVTLTNPAGTAGGALQWNTGGFVSTGSALLLSSTNADSTVTLTNAIDLNGASREVRVAQGSAAVDGILSGVLSNSTGTGGIVKTGDGTLQLSGVNTYNGATVIQGGALRGTVPSTSNLQLNGGVYEISANYAANVGTAAGEVRWTGSGGFSAAGADSTVNLNGASGVQWNTGNFVATGNSLILGSASATHRVELVDAIDLGGATRTIEIRNGSATTEARLSGALTNGGINVVGAGRLDLTGTSTYTGVTNITGAEVRLIDGGQFTGNTAITLSGGGALVLDNTGTAANYTRVHNNTDFTFNAGRLEVIGRTSGADSIEEVDRATFSTGDNVVRIERGASGGNTQLRMGNLDRAAGATVDFQSGNGAFTNDDTTDLPALRVGGGDTTDDGVFAYATVNGSDFATKSGNFIQAYTAYTTTAESTWGATNNVSLSAASTSLAASDRTVNTLRLADSADLNLNGRTLSLDQGGLLVTNGTGSEISNGTIRATGGYDGRELITHIHGSNALTISAVISNDGGNASALTKSGTGTLTLSGSSSNTYTGTTTVNAGTLQLNKSGGATAVAGNLVIGDTSGTDTVKILANEQIADTATVTLRGGTLLNNNNQAVLDIGNSLETFATLSVTGNSVIDFSGGSPSAPSFLVIDILTIATDAVLTVRNWIDAADYFLIKKSGLDSTTEQANIARIVFDGYGTATWEDYSSDYFMITPHASPVPEPAAYGLLSLGGLAGFALLRRRRRK